MSNDKREQWERDLDHFVDGTLCAAYFVLGALWRSGGWGAVATFTFLMASMCAFYAVRSFRRMPFPLDKAAP